MESNILRRQKQLSDLETYLNEVDTEVTMILQSLQWDRKHLLEQKTMVPCQYNTNHRVPPDKLMEHENRCFLKSQGYTENDRLLPSPIDPDANTLVKLNADNIAEIINNASRGQALFKTGAGCSGTQPLTLERLQATYTADERRAIHDAVVTKVPSCHDLSDLALLSSNNENKEEKPKSKLEILAELRDMKRRRTKYRVAAKTRNYSDVLRDVIHTQMELYTQAKDNLTDQIKKEKGEDIHNEVEDYTSKHKNTSRYSRDDGSNQSVNEDSVSHNYESRKRKYDDDNAYKFARATTNKAYEGRDNIPHSSKFKRNNYGGSNERDDRQIHSSSTNKDANKESRKRHREKYLDDRRETQNKEDNLLGKEHSKKDNNESSKNGSMRYADRRRDYEISEERYHKSERHYSSTQRQIHGQYGTSKLRRENNDGNTIKEKHYRDSCKQGSSYGAADHVLVKSRVHKEDSFMKNYSEDDESESNKSHHRHKKLKEKYAHDEKHKKKHRYYDTHQNKHMNSEKDDAQGLLKLKETKNYKYIKDELDIGKDIPEDAADASGNYRHRKTTSVKSYSKLYKEKRNYHDSSDTYRQHEKK